PAVIVAGLLSVAVVASLLFLTSRNASSGLPTTSSTAATTTPAAAPPTTIPTDLTAFVRWATANPNRLGRHADDILHRFADLGEGAYTDAARLVDAASRWKSGASLAPAVADALIAGLQAAFPAPPPSRGKGG